MKKKSRSNVSSFFTYGDPDMIFLEDRELIKDIWELCKPRLSNVKGTVIFYGTMGEEGINDWEAMFYQPTNYKLINKEK